MMKKLLATTILAAIAAVASGVETLWARYDGFGFGADECHAAYAFLGNEE